MAHETFRAGDLTAVIGDNEAYQGHRAGYNGVHHLIHRTNPKSLFTGAGLNLEHIFDGDQDLYSRPPGSCRQEKRRQPRFGRLRVFAVGPRGRRLAATVA